MSRLLLVAVLVLMADPALAASEGDGIDIKKLALHAFNLALILGLVIYLARKPILEYLDDRRQGIQRNLEDSAKLLEGAEAKLAEWTQRTSRLESELEEIRSTSRRLAEEERDAILAQARATAERIKNDAHAAVDQELRRARAELSTEAAELAMDLAAKMIDQQMGDADQERLFDEFVGRIEGGQG